MIVKPFCMAFYYSTCIPSIFLRRPDNFRAFRWASPRRRIQSSQHLSSSSHNNEVLAEQLQTAYKWNETDGILALAPTLLFSPHTVYSPEDYITASIRASLGDKLQIAGTLNALLAACHVPCSTTCSPQEQQQQAKGRQLAWDIFTAWQEWMKDSSSSSVTMMDTVSYCTTFTCLDTPIDMVEDEYDVKAEKLTSIHRSLEVLNLARRWSYKHGGNGLKKRRRNHTTVLPENMCLDDSQRRALKEMYGPDWDILLETEEFLVVNKPSGMVCYHRHRTKEGKIHKGKKTKASIYNSKNMENQQLEENLQDDSIMDSRDVSLEDALSALKIPLSSLNPEALGVVHRLDRGTSGCIIIAKNDSMHAKLVSAFFTRSVAKSYLAIVPYHPRESRMEARMDGHDSASFPSLEEGSTGIIDIKVQGKPALSEYAVLKIIREDLILLRVRTCTGRYHQVRQHCAQGLGRPILLDPEYDKMEYTSEPLSKVFLSLNSHKQRFFLHCESLAINSLQMQIHAPMPRWWNEILS